MGVWGLRVLSAGATRLWAGLARHDAVVAHAPATRVRFLGHVGAPEESMLVAQSNLASTYRTVGRHEESMRLRRDVYSGCARLYGEEHAETLIEANNLANLLEHLERFEEVKSLLRRSMPVARRVLGESHEISLKMRWTYGQSLYKDDGATLEDLRKAVTTLGEIECTTRRVLGGAHPLTTWIEEDLRDARAALRARETPPTSK